MGHFFLWVESLAASLLMIATVASFSARLKGFWSRLVWPVVVALAPLMTGVFAVLFAGSLRAECTDAGLLLYASAWTVLFVAGTALMLVFGLRRPDADEAAPRASTWPRYVLARTFAAALVAYLVTLFVVDSGMKSRLALLHEDATALALSLAPERAPGRRNAAAVYQRAFEAMGDPKSWRKLPWYNRIEEPEFDATAPEIKEFLRGKEPIAALLRKAAAMPDYYFETDYTQSVSMRIPSLLQWRNAAYLLVLDARSRAAGGDLKAALANIEAVWGMAEHCGRMPTLISLMVAVACDGTGTQALEQVLAAAGAEGEDVPPLAHAHVSWRNSFRRTMCMEEASVMTVFFMVYGDQPLMQESRLSRLPRVSVLLMPYRALLFESDLKSYRRWSGDARAVAGMPYKEALERSKELAEAPQTKLGILGSIVVPSTHGALVVLAEAEARHRLAELALAAAAYRARKGEYPASLGKLVPDFIEIVPTDPFSGEPLRMVAADGGLVLYSVYSDGKDNGGAEADSRGSIDAKGDLTFCLGGAYEKRRLEPALERARRRKAKEAKR